MTGRVALVTGASRGIGLEVTRQLAGEGYLVIAGARDLDTLTAETRELGDAVLAVRLDVTDAESVEQLDDVLAAQSGGVQVLVNNAGIVVDGWSGSILDVPLEDFRATWETNTLGAISVARAAMPHLRRSDARPRVVNVSSGMGQLADMGSQAPAYRTSKVMLNAVTRILAAEFGDELFVASVCPGWVRTDMGGASAPRSVEEGADGIVWLATVDEPLASNGRFWRDRELIEF